jgi:DNA-binding XRE family transcriptional regulator
MTSASEHDNAPSELPVRVPGGSELPPTSPLMLGKGDRAGGSRSGGPLAELPACLQAFRLSMGNAVKARRTGLGLTQGELARLAGCDRQTIVRLEKAHCSPTLDQWFKVAAALRVPSASARFLQMLGMSDEEARGEAESIAEATRASLARHADADGP